jgi:hypothetical protein
LAQPVEHFATADGAGEIRGDMGRLRAVLGSEAIVPLELTVGKIWVWKWRYHAHLQLQSLEELFTASSTVPHHKKHAHLFHSTPELQNEGVVLTRFTW